jgi:hypothetical protein
MDWHPTRLGRLSRIRIGGDTVTYEESGADEQSRRSDDVLRTGQDDDLPRDTALSKRRVRRG